MWLPFHVRGGWRFAAGDAGGETVLEWRGRHDDAWIAYNAVITSVFLARWVRRNWAPLFYAVAFGAWLLLVGRAWTCVLLAVLAGGFIAWRIQWPHSFERHYGAYWRAWWRMRRYRSKWQSVMEQQGHAMIYGGLERQPKICKVIATPFVDRLLVEPLNGQPIEDFEKNDNPSGLATAFKVQRCRVRAPREDLGEDLGRFWMDFYRRDALAEIVPPIDPAEIPDLLAVPVGRTEFSEPWTLKLFENHIFIAGITRAGKSGLIWDILRGVGPLIHNGTVEVWAVDPKGGMELNPGRALFTRFAKNVAEAAPLLNDAAEQMTESADRLMHAGKRKLEPSPDDSFKIVLVDELAHLIHYDHDKDRVKAANDNLQLLLSQGGAPGWCVIAAAQDPAKEIIKWRHQFPTVVGLRLKEEQQVKMLFGEGARARGTLCDKIPESHRGVAYVALEGVREEMRVRAAWIDDAMVKQTAAEYAAPEQARPLVAVA